MTRSLIYLYLDVYYLLQKAFSLAYYRLLFSLFLGVTVSCRAIRVKSSLCCGLYSSIPNAFLILPPPCQGMSGCLCSMVTIIVTQGQR